MALLLFAAFVELSEELVDTEEPSSRLTAVHGAILRLVLGVHYPSDVFGGLLLGGACALAMAVVLRRADRQKGRTAKGAPRSMLGRRRQGT